MAFAKGTGSDDDAGVVSMVHQDAPFKDLSERNDLRYALDFTKIKAELGWKPEISFKQGIREKINWYKQNEWWWKKLKGAD